MLYILTESGWHFEASTLLPVHPARGTQSALHVGRTPWIPLERIVSCGYNDKNKKQKLVQFVLKVIKVYTHNIITIIIIIIIITIIIITITIIIFIIIIINIIIIIIIIIIIMIIIIIIIIIGWLVLLSWGGGAGWSINLCKTNIQSSKRKVELNKRTIYRYRK